MGLAVSCPQPGTSRRPRANPVYPSLPRHRTITQPNDVWVMDIADIPMAHGDVYLADVMDWARWRVLRWRVSVTRDRARRIDAVDEAIRRYGGPTIFNTDQGAQPASRSYQAELVAHGMRASISRMGNCYDNAVAERFFATLEFERLMKHDWETKAARRRAIFRYFETWYDRKRRHSTLGYISPTDVET